jgi:hypothetical protein
MLNTDFVRDLFSNLEQGNSDAFFHHVADDVSWTVMGTHPLAGKYATKESFVSSTFARLNKVLKDRIALYVTNLLISEDTAVVELEARSTALNGKPFNNTYCWVVRFENDIVVEVRAYLDSALVKQLIEENES